MEDGSAVGPDAIYKEFDTLHAGYTEIDDARAAIGTAVYMGAYCVLWEIYGEAWLKRHVQPEELPAEVAEGDVGLWAEFAESLLPVENALTPRLLTGLQTALSAWAGDSLDYEVRKRRGEVECALGFEQAPS